MKLSIIVGTRPEIIKMSPIIRECNKQKIEYFIIHTGQHYSYNMDKIFFEKLEIPKPNYHLNVGSGNQGEQTGKILIGIEKILKEEKPDIVLVQGDTNSVLGGALATSKLQIKLGHVEAGLRSYDKSMPEEINRIITDHISNYLFAPTEKAKNILLHEGISPDKIQVTGNTIVDSVYQNLIISEKYNNILEKLELSTKGYFLVTIHRQENVDDKKRFKRIIKGLQYLNERYQYQIIFPIHPRSMKMIKKYNFNINGINLIDPVDYFSFLQLENNAKLILTDSGGIQEEACILKIPCVTIRDNTERPETIEIGSNILAEASPDKIIESVSLMIRNKKKWVNPFGDGTSAKKIINYIVENYEI